MTSRDWLDEQMDQADLWHEAEELRRDEIAAHFDDEDNYILGPNDERVTVRELSDRENS